jgi:hypothetical protein
MLRARVISEAIRTILPGVLSGCYLPDELESMPAVTYTATPVPIALPEPAYPIQHALLRISGAQTIDELREAWADIITAQPSHDDLAKLTAAKDNRKAELN